MSIARAFIVLVLITAVLNANTSLNRHQTRNADNTPPEEAAVARTLLRQAKAAALTIKNGFQLDAVLDVIGVAEAKGGDLDAAIETANQTRYPASHTLDAIGEQLGDADDPARAQALGKKLKSGGSDTILSSLARGQLKKGNIAGALIAAELIANQEIRSYALESIAIHQTANGDYPGARRTFLQARQNNSSGVVDADELELLIVGDQLSRGEMQAARATIGSLKSPGDRVSAMIGGAEGLWKKGDQIEAREWLEQALKEIPDGAEHESLRYFAIPTQVKLGQRDAAMQVAAALSPNWRVKGFMAVAVTCAEIKDTVGVIAGVEKMRWANQIEGGAGSSDFGLKLMILNVTAALIDNAQSEAADRWLSSLEEKSEDVSFSLSIEPRIQLQRVLMLAQGKRFRAARTLALKMRPDSITQTERGVALRMTALLQTKQDGVSQSRTWAQALTDNEDRAYALLGIAQGLLNINEVKLGYSAISIH